MDLILDQYCQYQHRYFELIKAAYVGGEQCVVTYEMNCRNLFAKFWTHFIVH